MICDKCGVDYSPSVYRIHRTRCNAVVEPVQTEKTDMTKPEIMEALREQNIKFNPRDKREVLESLLNFKDKFETPEEVY